MKYLQHHWRSRLFIVILVSILVSAFMMTLELTGWAEQINQVGYSHDNEEPNKQTIPPAMMYILPFVKEIILIGVPLLLTLIWLKLLNKLKSVIKKGSKC